ncbi:UDP-glucose 4-epimerase [Flavobacterium akiainvivens]|uniref:UDP-glucose 4-epimerase n=1 Tax=Flavobacterium akiainvivens TaxID=1202724 RepID=A0A0M9VI77_9FLAO|nr:NAD-dependent epimerase/dehydratase family protein [Flavobacterium akiainvivens]KOS06370.1 UDP-glucose 4-epimerase [Flavobacterium akiainvivens]SFQ14975.1 UDP-glucose 4-epimerase [Flavobacterium akiainvivens]
MRKVLIFGGFGFLGYYLVKELLQRGYQVTVADINDKSDLASQVNFLRCDIGSKENVDKVFESDRFDVVYNLAGFANLDRAVKDPLTTMQLNVLGNMYIIDACLKHNVTKFVYASSAYAVSNKGSFYGISKLASEKIVEEYYKKYNLNFTILRYGSVYSERNYDNNYIYNLVKEAVKNQRIDHKGDGKEIREYIHASDAAKLSIDVIETNEFDNMHVILTGTERMERIELFNMIKEILNNKVEISCNESGYHNHYRFTPYSFDPSVSKKLVANPHIDMGQGLLECVRAVYNDEQE